MNSRPALTPEALFWKMIDSSLIPSGSSNKKRIIFRRPLILARRGEMMVAPSEHKAPVQFRNVARSRGAETQ